MVDPELLPRNIKKTMIGSLRVKKDLCLTLTKVLLAKIIVKKKKNYKNWRIEMDFDKIKSKFNVWSLHYRTEIIWFVIGFVLGAIIL